MLTRTPWLMGTNGRYSSISRPEAVEGELRPGHVGGDGVDRALRESVHGTDSHPAHGAHDHRRGEVADGDDRLAGFGHVRRLQLGHLLVDDLESFDRVGDLNRQVVEQGRDPIVGHAMAVVVPRRHRHQRADDRARSASSPRERSSSR